MPAAPPARVVAVDWSGALVRAERKIWLCEVAAGGVRRLEAGRSREALVAELVRTAADRGGPLVAGLDFAFSLPDWFFAERGIGDAHALWALAAEQGDAWLAGAAPPFWGVRGARRPALPAHTRRTEDEAGRRAGRPPSSVFKLVGADQVGRGSVRGMRALAALAAAGFAVWPFDDPRPAQPAAIEIWPRLLYAEPVVKSRADARARYLDRHAPALDAAARAAAEGSDDAFDALTAALAMWEHRAALAALPPEPDPVYRREGRIWLPPAVAPIR